MLQGHSTVAEATVAGAWMLPESSIARAWISGGPADVDHTGVGEGCSTSRRMPSRAAIQRDLDTGDHAATDISRRSGDRDRRAL